VTLGYHPFANLFPLMEGEAFASLCRNVKAKGIHDKIDILDGLILDGRNRHRAGRQAGIKGLDNLNSEHFRIFDPKVDGDPLEYVILKNFERRQMSLSQCAMVADRLALLPRGGQAKPETAGKSKKTGAGEAANLPVSKGEGVAQQKVRQRDAAQLLNVSERLVRSARTVREHGIPELAAAVDRDEIAVSLAAQAAVLPAEQQRKVVAEAAAGRANVVRTVVKRERRTQREKDLGAKQCALPDGVFGFVLEDPEWTFKVWNAETGSDRSAVQHYPTSDLETIAARAVSKLCATDCVYALWCVDPERGLALLKARGFTFVSYLVWVKDIVEVELTAAKRKAAGLPAKGRVLVEVGPAGTGFWNRDRDELVLIGVRGNVPCPAQGLQGESVFFAARPPEKGKRRGRHSAKPANIHEWAEKHYPTFRKLELNAREARKGWTVWGNEAPEELNG
jgi:N6-adenosine-specific RNA methylase IME4